MQKIQVQSLGQEGPLKKGMIAHSSILAWRIPWTEEHGGLQSMGLQRVRHDWETYTFTFHFQITSYFSGFDRHKKKNHPRWCRCLQLTENLVRIFIHWHKRN